MIRIILQNIILFLMPTVIYITVMVIRKRAQSVQDVGRLLERAPLVWLTVMGAVLMIGGLAYFSTSTSGRPGETYQPPVYRDGKIIPGQPK